MKELYACDFKYGKPVLAKVTISKETEKTVIVAKYERILGWSYFGHWAKKDEWYLCIDLASALKWLHKASEEYTSKLQAEANEAKQRMMRIGEISVYLTIGLDADAAELIAELNKDL